MTHERNNVPLQFRILWTETFKSESIENLTDKNYQSILEIVPKIKKTRKTERQFGWPV